MTTRDFQAVRNELLQLRVERRFDEARVLVDRLRSEEPDEPMWLFEQGIQIFVEDDLASALPIFQEMAGREGFPARLESMLRCAEILHHQQRFDDAEAAYDLADRIFPGFSDMPRLRQVLADSRRSHDLVARLDRSRTRVLGEAELAGFLAELTEALDRMPQSRHLQLELGRCRRLARQNAEAIEILRPLADDATFSGQLESMIEWARAHDQAQEFDAAWQICQRIGALFPGHSAYPTLAMELLPKRGLTALALQAVVETYPGLNQVDKAAAAEVFIANTVGTQVAQDLAGRTVTADHLAAPKRLPASPHAAIIILTKDEADILAHNLDHHYDIGFRLFCIADNKSRDETAAIVTRFRESHPDCLVLYLYDPIERYFQKQKMDLLKDAFVRYAAIDDVAVEWVFFIDTDEFLACTDDASADALQQAMADPACHLIVFHWLIMASETPLATTPAELNPFLAYPVVLSPQTPVTKIAMRTRTLCQPTQGNHWVRAFDGPLESIRGMAPQGWFMFHFMVRSVDQMRRKVINGGRALLNAPTLHNTAGHWRDSYEAYLREGDAAIVQIVGFHVASVAEHGRTIK